MSQTSKTSMSITQSDPGDFQFVDIGVNLTDPVFRGKYRGKQLHQDDFDAMFKRSKSAGVKSMIVTGGSLSESRMALELAKQYNLYATVGCHPTRSKEFDRYKGGPAAYLRALDNLIETHLNVTGRVVAVGECGLDYDRLFFSPKETQLTHFRSQLSLAKKHHLPLFLHSRAAHADFVKILREEGFGEDGGRAVGAAGGVVHSFTGTAEEAAELISMGFHLSVNGCSLKTKDNINVVRSIPIDKLMLETDAPWCSMTSTHASRPYLDTLPDTLRSVYLPPAVQPERFQLGKPVKGRNEPAATGGVAWVVHRLHRQVPFHELTEIVWKTTVELFKLVELTAPSSDSRSTNT